MIERHDPPTLTFEQAYRALQEVVDRLEKGNLPLDESVTLFAYGTELAHRCGELLEQAELKVRALTQGFPAATTGLRELAADDFDASTADGEDEDDSVDGGNGAA